MNRHILKQKESFALITPSYFKDLERFELLVESMDRFVSGDYKHYVLADEKDMNLFRPFGSERRLILPIETMLPSWIYALPGIAKCRFSMRHWPIRNWILQQLVKLTVPLHVPEENLIYIDSDVAFIKPFVPHSFIVNGEVRLFKIPGKGNIASHYKWHLTASKLLGLPPQNYFGARYIGQMVSWRKENVIALHHHIEKVTEREWQDAICRQWNLSEYVLYGVFCDQILKERSGHYEDSQNLSLEYWETSPMNQREEDLFIAGLQLEHVSVMISAKAKMDREQHAKILDRIEKKVSGLS